jgi:hypothetical protein
VEKPRCVKSASNIKNGTKKLFLIDVSEERKREREIHRVVKKN